MRRYSNLQYTTALGDSCIFWWSCYRIGIECYKYYYYYYTLECEEVWRGRGTVHFVFSFFFFVGIVGVDKFGVDRWIQCLSGSPATLARGACYSLFSSRFWHCRDGFRLGVASGAVGWYYSLD